MIASRSSIGRNSFICICANRQYIRSVTRSVGRSSNDYYTFSPEIRASGNNLKFMESTSSFLGELTGSVLRRQEYHCVTAVLWCRCNWHALIETTHTSRRRQCDCNNNRYPMTDLATLDIDRANPGMKQIFSWHACAWGS